MMQRAQELQDLFKENTRIEQEKNQLLNQDEPVEVDFKPIIVESFPPAEPLHEVDFKPIIVESFPPAEPLHEVDFKTIIVESFPPAEPLHEHSGLAANLPGETSPVAPSSPAPSDATKGVKRVAKTRKKAASQATDERITVTIIQTGITSGKDPWAVLRDKYLPARKRRKSRRGMPEGHPDLWSLVENTVVEQALVVQQDEETTSEEFQQLTLF
jgi:hypothetical protein